MIILFVLCLASFGIALYLVYFVAWLVVVAFRIILQGLYLWNVRKAASVDARRQREGFTWVL